MSQLLDELNNQLVRNQITVQDPRIRGNPMLDFSISREAILVTTAPVVSQTIDELVTASPQYDRAVGSLVSLVVGDAVGHPLEFLDANSTLPPFKTGRGGREAFLFPTLDPADKIPQIKYYRELNQFDLKPGQWTDDASMALCLADSLLVCGAYNGGDCRIRFHCWWNHGYNNAFRNDVKRFNRHSVGLGGNISKSIDAIDPYVGMGSDKVPPVFSNVGEDAGNGSLMRLAPVPIRYSHNVLEAMDVAAQHSYSTHPGPDAAHCCRFLTYVVCRAIHRPMHESDMPISTFIDIVISEYLSSPKIDVHPKLKSLLTCTPPSATEQCWDWKAPELAIAPTLKARGKKYNGHPVSADYFGAYCMDGLAMALWAL
eukprot:PhF_6_TR4890/c0_g1_i1/m.6910